MRLAGAASRPGLVPDDWGASVRRFVRIVAAAALLGLLVAAGPVWWRLLVAATMATLLLTLMLTRPRVGLVATFVYLMLLGFLRRLLIGPAGWSSADPMLLVGPLVALVAIVMLFALQRRPLAPDGLSKLIVVLILGTLLEVFNPAGGIGSGIAGLLFTLVPLLWFFVGREILDDQLVDKLLLVVLALGTVVAVYGLVQTEIGFPPWDVDWLSQVAGGAGYNSLNVGGTVRAFGTFASAAEYALAVGAALVIAATLAMRGRLWALLPIPLLAVALVLASGRSPLILAFVGVIVTAALRPRRPVTALVVTVITFAVAYVAIHFLGSGLSSGNSLVSHEIGGITDPLNPGSSTLLLHLQLAWDGIKDSIHHVVGQGDGATNLAAGINQNSAASTATNAAGKASLATEIDISNAFVIFGPVGGVLYLFTVILILWRAVVGYFAGRDVMLPVIGVLIVALGQWLIGGDYAVSSLCWLLIGSVAASSAAAVSPPAPRTPTAVRVRAGPR